MTRTRIYLATLFACGMLLHAGCEKAAELVGGDKDETETTTQSDTSSPPPTPAPSTPAADTTPKLMTADEAIDAFKAIEFGRVTDADVITLRDRLEAVDGLETLTELSLVSANVGQQTLDILPDFAALESLDLAGTALPSHSLEPLTRLKQLQTLSFRQTNFADDDCEAINSAPALLSLNLTRTQISDAGIAKLGPLPKLEVLIVNTCPQVSGEGFKSWPKPETLRELQASQTRFGSAPMGAAGLAGTLELLSAGRSGFTDDKLRGVKNFAKLRELYLDSSSISDFGVAQMRGWKSIQRLGLGKNRGVTNRGLEVLLTCPQLHFLDLLDTGVSQAGVEEFLQRKNTPMTIVFDNRRQKNEQAQAEPE